MASRLPPLQAFRSVTIIKPSSLGDIVHTLPVVSQLRKEIPNARFRWLANSEWVPLLEGNSLIDEVIAFPRKTFRGPACVSRLSRWLVNWRSQKRERPELVIDFQGLLRSALLGKCRGGDLFLGLSDAREGASWFYPHHIKVNSGDHAVDRYCAVATTLGIKMQQEKIFPMIQGSRPTGWPNLSDVVVVHPFSRGAGKALDPAVLHSLLDGLAPHPVVVIGHGTNTGLENHDHVIDLTGVTTLPELVWCMREARQVVSVDSGPMHIAGAVNPHTLGIHTWTDPRKVGPYPAHCRVWKAGRIAGRNDFTDTECLDDSKVTPEAAKEIASWLVANLHSR